MKAQDFCYGDYLNTSFGVGKVVAIDKLGLSIELLEDKSIVDIEFYDEEQWMQEIPLTPEILEKNGFKYNPFGTGFYECKTEEGNIACTKTDYWLFYINDNIIPNHFYYVHELRHALKLCGIEKTIEL